MQKQFIKGLVTKTAEGKYKVLASTSAIDRQGDSIDQTGWDLTNFKLNPVMPWAHDYSALPVAKVTEIEVTDLGLEAGFEFAPAEGNPMAQQVKVLYDEGYLNAVSVGFIPKQRNGNIITAAELLEISFVPVPANQEALRLTMKSIDENPMLTEEYRAQLKSMFKEVTTNGAVSDELDIQEAEEQKWEKWTEVCEVLSAFWDVYFDEATPVESFSALLNESIGLLQEVADSDGIDPDEATEQAGMVAKAMNPESTKALMELMAKSGRTLSKKTLDSMEKAIGSMKDAVTVLEQLKADSSADAQDGESGDSADEKAVDLPIEINLGEIRTIRQALVASDKSNELVLSLVNELAEKLKVRK